MKVAKKHQTKPPIPQRPQPPQHSQQRSQLQQPPPKPLHSQPDPPPFNTHLQPPVQHPLKVRSYASSSSSSSSSGSDSDTGASASDSSDPDDDGNGGHGKRPPSYMRASKKYPSKGVRAPINTPKDKKEKKKEKKPRIPGHITNAPISLSDSLPVYSQQILDGAMLLLPATSKFNLPSGATHPGRGGSTAGRGRGRGRARVPLAAGRSKYDASGAAIEVDFNESSPPPEDPISDPVPSNSYPVIQTTTPPSVVPVPVVAPTPVASSSPVPTVSRALDPPLAPVKKEPSVERAKPGPKPGRSAGTAAGTKPKSSKKVGRPPKSVSKDVYCICRGPYDGVEFMIACDRCEGIYRPGYLTNQKRRKDHLYPFCDR